ncbi:hypothetical protein ACP70R_042618 [Stipagrostis hirtigluma subsp. patula]
MVKAGVGAGPGSGSRAAQDALEIYRAIVGSGKGGTCPSPPSLSHHQRAHTSRRHGDRGLHLRRPPRVAPLPCAPAERTPARRPRRVAPIAPIPKITPGARHLLANLLRPRQTGPSISVVHRCPGSK